MMSRSALAFGAIATIVAFAALPFMTMAFFVSPPSMMMAGVLAHTVGMAVAVTLDLPSSDRTLARVAQRLAIVVICGIAVWVVFLALFISLAYTTTHFYRDYWWLQLFLAMAMAFWFCAVAVRRVEPAWPRYAVPLAAVAMIVTGLTLAAVIQWSARYLPEPGVSGGGPNLPAPEPVMAPPDK